MRSSIRGWCKILNQQIPKQHNNARSLQTHKTSIPHKEVILSHWTLLRQNFFPNIFRFQFTEFEAEMPWGPVKGKWWGRQDVRPIVAIHGWLDNAGSFDRLIPLLPDHVGYLAIDLPGHGRSAHFPRGVYYTTLDFLRTIETMRLKMKWDRISLMAHSMGSQISFYYSSIKPDNVDMFIGIDVLKPVVRTTTRIITDNIKQIDQMMIEDSRQNSEKEPPSYTHEDLVARVVKGSQGSVKPEFAHHLIERAVSPSAEHENQFYFHRDGRMKFMNYSVIYHELALDFAKRIVAPHLFIKANQARHYENECYFNDTIEVLSKSNPNFCFRRAEGGHHIHLTEPENICQEISKFICKYRDTNSA